MAFYASTPAYEAVLKTHGYEELRPELTAMSKQGRWAEMGELIDDTLLEAFCVIGEPAACGRELAKRWGDLFDRATLYFPAEAGRAVRDEVVGALRAALERARRLGSEARMVSASSTGSSPWIEWPESANSTTTASGLSSEQLGDVLVPHHRLLAHATGQEERHRRARSRRPREVTGPPSRGPSPASSARKRA